MAGGKRARRAANAAAEASREQANLLKEQTNQLRKQAERNAMRAQKILFRSLRARGGGFFESDSSNSLLGGSGVLG